MVIMTAFITHCWKNARLDVLSLLVYACLFWGQAGLAQAQSSAAEISHLKFERADDSLVLSATVDFELSAAVEDALRKGVAMVFFAEATVYRQRWYWMSKKVANVQRHMRLTYQPLTRRWRLNVTSDLVANAAMALNQTFESLPDALAAVQRISRWKIANMTDIDLAQAYSVEFSFSLDVSQLPRPFQIGTLGQSDWTVAAFTRQALPLESPK
jgi:hypothetical protein